MSLSDDVEMKKSQGFSFASSSPCCSTPVIDTSSVDELRKEWRRAQLCIWACELTPTYEIALLHKFDMMSWLSMY